MNPQTDHAATVHITTLRVTGIRRGTCAAYIGRALEGISGVVHVDVHQRETEIVVEHLPTFVDPALMAASIRQLGYGAEVHMTVPDVASEEEPRVHAAAVERTEENRRWWNLGTSTIG